MATINDQSIYNHDGTTVGDPDAVAGYVGKGIDLNGTNQYVTTPDSTDLEVTQLTIMGWVYLRNSGATQAIFCYWDSPYGYWMKITSADLLTGTIGNGSASTITGVTVLPQNAWTHCAFTFDGTTERLYVNGILDAEIESSIPNPTYVPDVSGVAGALSNDNGVSYSQYLNAVVDEIFVYDNAKDACFIRQYIHDTINSLDTRIYNNCPEWWWQLDEVTGTVAENHLSNISGDLTYSADASTFNSTPSQFDQRGNSKDFASGIVYSPEEPFFPLDWNENLYETPSQFGYRVESATGGTEIVKNRYTVGERFQDEHGVNNPFRIRCLAHGNGGDTRADQVVCHSKMVRLESKGGKFVFAFTRTYSGGSPYMNLSSSSHQFNVQINSGDVRTISLQSNARSYIGNVYTPEGSATFNAVWNVGSKTYFFVDLDNDLITVNTNSNTLLPSESIAGVLSGWITACCANAGDNNGGGDTDFNPDLTGITLPSGTVAGDWTGWNDWTEWQTDYEFYPLVNNASAYTAEQLNGVNTVQQGSLNGGIEFNGRLITPDFVVPTTGTWIIIVQQTSDLANDNALDIEIRINDVDNATPFAVSNEPFASGNWEGGTIGSRNLSLTAGDTINLGIKARTNVTQLHCCGNIYFVRSI